MMDRLVRAPELEQAARDFGAALDAMRAEIRARGLPAPTDEEIDAEVRAIRPDDAAGR